MTSQPPSPNNLPASTRTSLPREIGGIYPGEAPPQEDRTADAVVQQLRERLAEVGWQGTEGSPGTALAHIFGRMAELIMARLNQTPEKHFLAFLDRAGISLLPPQSAGTELTFGLPDDYEGFVRVPAGTQVATPQSETQAEVIFETEHDINVVPAVLVKCVSFDPLYSSDYTPQALGQAPGPFPAFQGQQERERVLYLGDDQLFAFDDAATRQAATVTIHFQLAEAGDPAWDGWELTWLYWDPEAESWTPLEQVGAGVQDNTAHFSQDGTVELSGLPELAETEVHGQEGLWIACRLTGGRARDYLPSLSSVAISRAVTIDDPVARPADAALSAIQSGTAFVPLDPAGEFFPLGQRPGRLDTFYLRADEAFTKGGASATIDVELHGVPERDRLQRVEDLEALRLTWEYHSAEGWTRLGVSAWDADHATSERLSFSDGTQALTASGQLSFDIPGEDAEAPVFAPAAVDGEEGYWLRARVTAGSYDEPGGMSTGAVQAWNEPRTHAPLITGLSVAYQGYGSGTEVRPIARCVSQVDSLGRDHLPDLEAERAFAPFAAVDEGPSLYLGFSAAFPEGEWVQVLLDVAEDVQASWPPPTGTDLYWEHGSGPVASPGWTPLRVSDGTRSLRERGYLGFFGPEGQAAVIHFGRDAYWIRVRLPRPPRSNPGSDQEVTIGGGTAEVTLDAGQSQVFDQKEVARYHWRLVSSSPPDAVAGPSQDITTGADRAVVTLDASDSQPVAGRPIARYIWRRLETEEPDDAAEAPATPYLNRVLTNIVAARNSLTYREEALGSSNVKPHQSFSLARAPVLPGTQIAVREPDRPPSDELGQLQWELEQVDGQAQALPADQPTAPGQGVWTRWHEVPDFHFSSPYSRHYTLDPISGEVRFGDGRQGKIPPVGRDNIKVLLYRTHSGVNGNVGANSLTVLRNPSGDLAEIKLVTNHEATGGGSQQEPVDQVKRRGPQAFKHRQRAVTLEDFEWIAREAGGNLARIRCLPTRNPLGLSEAGWVTVVITPETATEKKPLPTPALLRRVEGYLQDRSLVNLTAGNQIHVRGPEYIGATVVARVVPLDPRQADVVEIAVLQRLETFLHPLLGGPQREGWELGRDVYISEIYAEMESVPGVDHVAHARLLGTIQQSIIRLRREAGSYRQVPFDLLPGVQVSTFDERIKLRLAQPLRSGEDLARLAVHGFKVGDLAAVVAADNTPVRDNLTIADVAGGSITFQQAFLPPANWSRRDALLSPDGRLRLPLAPNGYTEDDLGNVTGVTLLGFQPGDRLSVVPGPDTSGRPPQLEFLPVEAVEACEDRVFIPQGHLVFSGNHDIDMALE